MVNLGKGEHNPEIASEEARRLFQTSAAIAGTDVEGQQYLPLGYDFGDPIDIETWPGYRLMADNMATLSEARRGMKDVFRVPATFAGRWAARVGLPLAGVYAGLQIGYHPQVDGIDFQVEGSLFSHTGFSADTSVGNWEFPNVDGLPVGIHLIPQNVNGLEIAKQANPDVHAYAEKLREDLNDEIPIVATVLGLEVLGGAIIGAGGAASINMARRYLRGEGRRPNEMQYRRRQALLMSAATLAVAAYGAGSYSPDWAHDSQLTGTLAEAQGLKDGITSFYNQKAKVFEVTQALIAIQSSLQEKLDTKIPATAFNAMYISDMHLMNNWPEVAKYAEQYDVKLIIDTGDESEFGTRAEMTSEYLDAVREVAKKVPILWVAGNHDSPETVTVMRSIPGVIVLGTKTQDAHGNIDVTAQQVDAYGLRVGGVPDPRVYGAKGVYGGDDLTTPSLEQQAVDNAIASLRSTREYFDTFMTHELVAGDEIAKILTVKHLRQINVGHTHAQNSYKDIQNDPIISLVEGSTGQGGLDSIAKGTPMEFTIASWAEDCQETKLLRFQITSPNPHDLLDTSQNVETIYLKPQAIAADRTCGTDMGIGPVQDILPGTGSEVTAAGSGHH